MMQSLAKDIYDWCKAKDLWCDIIIYFDGKAWKSDDTWGADKGKQIDDELFEFEDRDPYDYIQYSNRDTITMSFEGSLNHVLNGYVPGWTKLESEFGKLFEKYGLYYEMGYAWSLAAYEL